MYHQPSAPPGDGGPYLFQWNDDRCNMKNNFICKYSLGNGLCQRKPPWFPCLPTRSALGQTVGGCFTAPPHYPGSLQPWARRKSGKAMHFWYMLEGSLTRMGCSNKGSLHDTFHYRCWGSNLELSVCQACANLNCGPFPFLHTIYSAFWIESIQFVCVCVFLLQKSQRWPLARMLLKQVMFTLVKCRLFSCLYVVWVLECVCVCVCIFNVF